MLNQGPRWSKNIFPDDISKWSPEGVAVPLAHVNNKGSIYEQGGFCPKNIDMTLGEYEIKFESIQVAFQWLNKQST